MRLSDGAYNPLVPYLASAMQCPACGADALLPASGEVRCGSCGAAFADPEGVWDTTPGALEPGGWLKRLARSSRWSRWLEATLLPFLWRWAGPLGWGDVENHLLGWFRPVPGPVLDLDSGTGRAARTLARWVGVARVIAVDPSRRTLERTRRDQRDPGLAYVRAPSDALPFKDGAVGGVVAMDPRAVTPQALPAWGRVLGDSGVVVALVRLRGGGLRGALGALLGGPCWELKVLEAALSDAELVLRATSRAGGLALIAAERRQRA